MEPLYSPQSRAERLIAAGRMALAASSLFAVWLDPTEPAKYAQVAYSLLVFYVLYSAVIAAVVFRSDPPPNRQRLFTQVFDLSFFSLFLYLTAGPASPFLIYFVFSLVCATLRWQRRGVLWATVASLGVLLGLGLFSRLAADPSFQLYPLVIRGVYLAVIAVLLGYLGAHEEQTRREMASLAAWPDPLPQDRPQDVEPLVCGLLEHATQAVGAGRALLAWGEREEPWLYLALWDGRSCSWTRASPGAFGQLVAEPLQEASFLCPDVAHRQPAVLLRTAAGPRRWRGRPLDPALRERYAMGAVLALRVVTESLEGRLFFLDKKSMTSDDLVLGEVVADALARRLDHFYLNRQLQETVATEERIRLARDLHDGVLQSLTGIGLRLAAIRGHLDEKPGAAREALEALQRLIALEQRDIRFFIRELKPPPLTAPGEAQSLPFRLADLVQRVEVEWGLKVDLRTEGLEEPMPQPLARDVYHLVREGLVNAVRHGEASEVRVEILRHGRDRLAITVVDNGRGFPFEGRLTHRELAEGDLGPRNLLERIASLDGTLTLESSARGARLEIALPWAEVGA